MPYDHCAKLWPNHEEQFFNGIQITHQVQDGPHCVSTCLAMLADNIPENFQGLVNTQDPTSWSDSLRQFGMKLAYCPYDARKLKYYIPEMVRIDDLFAVCYYTATHPEIILGEPDTRGWITGSHIVLLHRDQIYDPMESRPTPAIDHYCNANYTKRIFRVVPDSYPRGI